jgi:hypothetical protein
VILKQVRMTLIVISLIVWAIGARGLQACSWCERHDIVTVIRDELAGLPVQGAPRVEGEEFYHECIYTYYPKAYVITETYFAQMCPDAIDSALYEIVRVLTYDTWFYFSNKEHTFRWSASWERVITVCEAFDQFFTHARVDRTTRAVYGPSSAPSSINLLSDTTSLDLISWWYATGKKAFFDFYALYFDYYIKLFNEAIKVENEAKALTYYQMLEAIVGVLEGSDYYATYEKALKRAERLGRLLHTKRRKEAWRRCE